MSNDSPVSSKPGNKPARFAIIAAVLAFLACNASFILIAVFSAVGIGLVVNPHIQAAIISLLAILTLGLVLSAWRKTKQFGALILAILGTVTIIGTMYIEFNKVVESLGLLMLFIAAIWSWRVSN